MLTECATPESPPDARYKKQYAEAVRSSIMKRDAVFFTHEVRGPRELRSAEEGCGKAAERLY